MAVSPGRAVRALAHLLLVLSGVLAAALFVAPSPARAATCTITWTGGASDGRWTTAGNWSPARIPTTTDYACIPSGAGAVSVPTGNNIVLGVDAEGSGLTINGGTLELTDTTQPSIIRNLSFSSGTLNVDSGVSLSLPGAATWSGGVLTGAGTTTVPSGSTLAVTGAVRLQGGHTLLNQATVTWSAGSFCFGGGAVIENQAAFNITVDGQGMSNCVGGTAPRFHNAAGGTVTRNGSVSGLATIAVPFDNDGLLQGVSGTLRFTGGSSTAATGTIDVASGATIELNGGTFTFASPAKEQGAGLFLISGGTVTGDLVINGTAQWSGGVLGGAGTTTVGTGGTLNVTGAVTLSGGHTLLNQGTVNWSGGSFCFGGGAVIENSGAFNISVDGQGMSNCVGGTAPRFHNAAGGTVTRNGGVSGLATIAVPFDNDGLLRGTSGTLRFTGGSSTGTGSTPTTGTIDVASGATIELNGGTFTFASPAKEQGAGLFLISGGTVTGDLVINGTAQWSGGVLSGAGTTTVAAGGTLNVTGAVTLQGGHTLANQGTVNWSGGSFCFGGGAVIENSAAFNISVDGQGMSNCVGGTAPRFHNAAGGTVTRNGSAGGLATIAVPFDNDGLLQGTSGILRFTGGSSAAATGTIDVASGATIELNGGTFTFASPAKEQGAGLFLLSGGTVTGDLVINGTAEWSGTDMNGTGTTTIGAGATVNVTNAVRLQGGHTLLNQGTINWTAGNFCVGGGAVIENQASFVVAADGQSMSNCVGGTAPRFHNAAGGTVTRTGASGTVATIGIPFDNDGLVQGSSATLALTGGSTTAATGTIDVASGATVQINGGTFTFASPAKEQGAGLFLLSGGTVAGDLVVNGTAEWSGTVLNGTGTTTIAPGATVNVTNAVRLQGGHTLLNQGTINWTAGNFCVGGGAVLDNAGVFIAAADGQSISNCVGGTAPAFHNRAGATLVRSSSATTPGTVTISIPFDNAGTIRLVSGVLAIQGDYTNPAGATIEVVLAGTTPGTQFGQLQVSGTATLGGTLSVLTSGGFTPTTGQTFDAITCGVACNGTFANVTGGTASYAPQSVTVNGVAPGAPAVSLSPTSLSFASQDVGTTSAAQTVTVTNTGNAPLAVSGVTLSGTNAGDFTKSADTCTGATIAPSASCTVSITFSPSAAGPRSATLSIADNAPGSPHNVPLSGTGATPATTTTTTSTTTTTVPGTTTTTTLPGTTTTTTVPGTTTTTLPGTTTTTIPGTTSTSTSTTVPPGTTTTTSTTTSTTVPPGTTTTTAPPPTSSTSSTSTSSSTTTSSTSSTTSSSTSVPPDTTPPTSVPPTTVPPTTLPPTTVPPTTVPPTTAPPTTVPPTTAPPTTVAETTIPPTTAPPTTVPPTTAPPTTAAATTTPLAAVATPLTAPAAATTAAPATAITTPTPTVTAPPATEPSTTVAPPTTLAPAPQEEAAAAPPPAAPADVPAAPLVAMSTAGASSGPPGVGLRVAGSGYPSSCDTVYFFFDGTRIGEAHPSDGAVAERGLSVPGEADPGSHEVTSSCRASGEPVMQTTAFEVTHADLHRIAPITALPKPDQVDFSLGALLTSAAVAMGILFLIAFPGELFNTTLEEHYDEVRGWFHLPPKRIEAETGRSQVVPFIIFLLVGGLLYSLLNPAFRLDRSTLAAALGLSIAMGIVTLAFDIPSLAYIRRRHGVWGRLVILPGTLVLAAGCVLLSRVVHFLPGYFYGLIAGITFRRQVAEAVKGRLVAASALLVLVMSVLSWLALKPVSAAADKPGATFAILALEATLGGIFWCGLDSLVIGLLPLRFLSGSEVRAWSRPAWIALFVLTQIAFVHILLRPSTGYVADTRRSPTVVVVGLFVAFAVFSVAFWAWFRFRDERQPEPEENWVEVG